MAMNPADIYASMKNKVETLTADMEKYTQQIAKYEDLLKEATNTREKAQQSLNQFETMMASIASEWGMLSDPPETASRPKDTPKPKPKKSRTRPEVKAEVTPKPEPKSAPTGKVMSEPDTKAVPDVEPVNGSTSVTDGSTGEEDVISVVQDGVRYVVFLDSNEVAEEDDEEETIIGKWDSSSKKIVLEV